MCLTEDAGAREYGRALSLHNPTYSFGEEDRGVHVDTTAPVLLAMRAHFKAPWISLLAILDLSSLAKAKAHHIYPLGGQQPKNEHSRADDIAQAGRCLAGLLDVPDLSPRTAQTRCDGTACIHHT